MDLTKITNSILDTASSVIAKTEAPKVTPVENGVQKIQNALDGLAASNSILVQKSTVLSSEDKLANLIQKGVCEKIAKNVSKLDDKQYKRYIELLDKGTNQFFAEEVAKLNNEQYQTYQMLIGIGYNSRTAKSMAILSDAEREKVRILAEKNIPHEVGIILSKYKDEDYEKVLKLIDMDVCGVHFLDVPSLSESQFDEVVKFINSGLWNCEEIKILMESPKEIHENYFGLISKGVQSYNAKGICTLEQSKYLKIKEVIDHGGDGSQFWNILDFDKGEYEKLLALLDMGLKEDTAFYISLLKDKEYQNALKLIDKGFRSYNILEISRFNDNDFQKALNLTTRGLSEADSISLTKQPSEKYEQIITLLENGKSYPEALEIIQNPDKCNKIIQEIKSTPNPIRDFLDSETYSSKLKIATQGKYQKELMELLSPETMTYATRKAILEGKINEEDFFEGIKKLSKSGFKHAMNTPNQYLANIPIDFTIKVDGKYPPLPPEILASQQKEVMKFFSEHLGELIRASKYLDSDTFNQLMDKRTHIFGETLEKLHKSTDENYSLISKLIKCKNITENKTLTPRDKIALCRLVQLYQKANIDTSILCEMASEGKVDIQKAKQVVQYEILKASGIEELKLSDIPMEKLQFNEEFSYLALKDGQNIFDGEEGEMMRENLRSIIQEYKKITNKEELRAVVKELKEEVFQDTPLYKLDKETIEATEKMEAMFENISEYSEEEAYEILYNFARLGYSQFMKNDELYTVIRESALGDFSKFISNTANKYGKTNAETQKLFEQAGLNFDKWLSPEIEDIDFEVADKKMSIKLWDRNPQEDLFMGNKTTCCTAIGTGGNAGSTPLYLLNKSFNVIDLFDDKGNLVGMSRVYMSEIGGKPSLILDNIELNETFIKGMSDEEKIAIRDNIFKYANTYAEKITGKSDSQVYFSPSFSKVRTSDLAQEKTNAKFIGKINQDKIYINAAKGWINPNNPITEKGEQVKWLVVPKNV